MANVAILASGSGSTAETFIRHCHTQRYPLQTKLVVCNNPHAFVLQRVEALNDSLGLNIATAVINSKQPGSDEPIVHGQQTEAEQQAMLDLFRQHQIDLVLLLGYMKKIGPLLLEVYGWQPGYTSVYQARMLNTHPGLLPDTIGTHGLGTQEFTLAKGLREAGQTLHVVSAAYDTGPTVAEHRVSVGANDTAESLFARVQEAEKRHIAADVAAFVQSQETYRKEG